MFLAHGLTMIFYIRVSRCVRTGVVALPALILSFGLFSPSVFATDALQCGVPVEGSIAEKGDKVCYTFEGNVGDVVALVLTDNSKIQARMDVFPPSSALEPVVNGVSKITDLQLQEDGTYTIFVYDRGNDATGDYWIGLEWNFPANRRCLDFQAICGELTNGSIDVISELDVFSFDGNAGDMVNIRLSNASRIESRLDLFAPNGSLTPLLSEVSGLLEFELPEDGTYVGRIYDQGNGELGSYTFGMDWSHPAGKQCSTPTPLSCGEVLSTSIDSLGELDLYSFDGEAGDVVTLRMTNNSSVESRFDLFAPSSRTTPIIQEAAGFRDVLLAETGTYTVRVYDLTLNETGEYFLSLDWVHPLARHCGPIDELNCGRPVDETIERFGEVDYFSFRGSTGEVLALDLDNTPGSPVGATLDVFGPGGSATPILQGSKEAVQINLEEGDYLLRVYDDGFPETGGYEMSVECQGEVSLTCGETVDSSIDVLAEVDIYTFEALAGEVVLINLTDTGDIDARFDLFLPSDLGNPVLLEIGGSQPLLITEDGTHLLWVYDRSDNETGSYTLNYSCQPNVEMNCGDNILGSIETLGELDLYTFAGAVGDVVSLILANNNDAEARFDLFAPSSAVIPLLLEETQKHDIRLTEAGTYLLRVYDRGHDELGDYSLSLEWLGPALRRCREIPSVGCGQAASDSIDGLAQTDLFSFAGNAGDFVSLLLTNDSEIESRMDVFTESAPEAPLLSEVTDFHDLTLQSNETYFVRIYDAGFDESGPYSLSFDWVEPENKRCRTFEDLTCGSDLSRMISLPSQVDYFRFDGMADDLLTLQLTDDLLVDARFDLLGPGATPILKSQNGIHDVLLPETGSHVLRVYDIRSPETGRYTLGVIWSACDCNGNGVEDVEEIGLDPSKDQNQNNLIDSCEPPSPSFRRGDADTSGEIDFTDAINTLNFLFVGSIELLCLDAADADDSGTVDFSDPINTLRGLFLGEFEIPPPGRDCGPDPTADPPESEMDQGCESYSGCGV